MASCSCYCGFRAFTSAPFGNAGFSVGNRGDLCGNLQVLGSVDLIWKPESRRTLWDSMYIVVYIVYKRWGFYSLKRNLKVL